MSTNKTSKAKNKRRKKRRGLSGTATTILTVFLILFMIGVITAGSVAFTVFKDVGLLDRPGMDYSKEIAGVDYIDLENYISQQQKTTIIYAYDEDGELYEETRLFGSQNREAVKLEDVSPYIPKAVVALEDKRFNEHRGVDWIRTIGSIYYDLTGGRMQGGSTITQQLIKNLTGDNKVMFIRKYKEIKNALALERHFDKDQILEAYLNTIYLDMGQYGIKTGAEYYFGKDVKNLTLMESAMLVSITQAPRGNNPIINPKNNRERAEMCLRNMLEQGMISQTEYDKALKEKVELVGKKSGTEVSEGEKEISVTTTEYQSYYTDYIIDTVIKDLTTKYGMTENEAWRKVYFGGLRIYSAVDVKVQSEMEDVYYNRITFPVEVETETSPVIQSAMTIMDYEGRVVGIVGRLGEKQGNRVLNIASDSPRQPGSSIKPLSCYAPAIELNCYTWSSYLANYGLMELSDDNKHPWPSNYGGNYGSPSWLVNLQQAIAPSYNTVPARIVYTLTPQRCFAFVRDKFHISTLLDSDCDYAPMAIGAMGHGVTTLDMAAAYATFGNGGKYYKPWCYYKVTDADGNIVLEPDLTPEQVISPGTADVMNQLMRTVVTSGTCTAYNVKGFTSFAKSGTTSDNYDKWIVGGTPYYICATWSGFEINREISTRFYGSNPSGKVYKEVMDRIHSGLESKEFEMSGDAVRRSFCTATGQLASSSCRSCSSGWYKIDYMPRTCTSCSGGRKSSSNSTTAASEDPVF